MAASRSAARPTSRDLKLELFVWEGTDKRGVKTTGEQAAKSLHMVRAELRRQGINPTVVKPKPIPLFGSAGKTVTAGDSAVFSRQLATMMKSGVPIVGALEIIAGGQKNPRMNVL